MYFLKSDTKSEIILEHAREDSPTRQISSVKLSNTVRSGNVTAVLKLSKYLYVVQMVFRIFK